MNLEIEHSGKFVSVEHLIMKAGLSDADSDSEADRWQCWDQKFWELGPKFVESIQQNGIARPVDYEPDDDWLVNGHHRVIVCWLLGIEQIEYYANGDDLHYGRRQNMYYHAGRKAGDSDDIQARSLVETMEQVADN